MRKRLLVLIISFITLVGCSNTSFSNGNEMTIVNEEIQISNFIEKNGIKHIYNDDSYFEVHYIDVGQGDAALIMCDDKYLLIDGGPSSASQIMYAYLKNYNINFLDYIICSHPDEDHVGGLSGALNYADVGVVYSPGGTDTEAFNSFVTYVDKSGSFVEIPAISSKFNIGSADVEILASNIGTENDQSIVVRIDYGETSFLFTGDAETLTEEYLINNKDINCDVLKISHHGSNTATGDEFLDKCSPQYAVISVGKYNTYGHPTEQILERLNAKNIKLYRTDLNGDIIIYSDGKDLVVETERNTQSITRQITQNNFKEHSEYKYCLNTNSMRIHYVDCESVHEMSDKNKLYTNEDREILISKGYKPYGKCNP